MRNFSENLQHQIGGSFQKLSENKFGNPKRAAINNRMLPASSIDQIEK